MSKRVVGGCIAAVGALALSPASASAATSATHVTIAIKPVGNGFRGKVTSPRTRCVADRKVTLQRRKAGQDSFTGVGSDWAASDGIWSVKSRPVNQARYRAVIKTKVGAKGCLGAVTEATTAHKTSVTIAAGSSNFHGKVSSAACAPDRKVLLQRRAPSDSSFRTIGSDVSGKEGRWLVNKSAKHGSAYRATARAKQVTSTTSCMRGRSNTVHG
jgi:hypothetical protein